MIGGAAAAEMNSSRASTKQLNPGASLRHFLWCVRPQWAEEADLSGWWPRE